MALLCLRPAWGFEITVRVGILMDQQAVSFHCSRGLVARDGVSMKQITTSPGRLDVRVKQGKIFLGASPAGTNYVYVLTQDYHTPISLNGVGYRGYFLAVLNGSGRLMVINHVGLEDYLAGVLGGEIIPSWPIESIKAQAVAARTYALYKIQEGKGTLYDLVNNTADQMYVGVRGETPSFIKALQETRAQVLARDGRIICAYYHSNSGGFTSDSSVVFKIDRGGLQGVKDPYSNGAPNGSWSLTLSSEELQRILSRNGSRVGRIFVVKPLGRDAAGRVTSVKVDHEKGSEVIHASDFRRLVGYGSLKSTMFTVTPGNFSTRRCTRIITPGGGVMASTMVGEAPPIKTTEFLEVPGSFTFRGAGWGHGVGMSQWGARKMAEMGCSYRQILMHYYPGTDIYSARARE
jgi:stage II sporulation protein D